MKIPSIITRWFVVVTGGLLAGALTNAATILQSPSADYLGFEADQNVTLIAGTPTTWVRTNDVAASGGSALYAEGIASPGDGPHSFAQYQLRFATPGTYYLYYRWKADPARTAGDIFTANSTYIPNTFGNLTTPGDQTSFHASASNGRNAPESNVYGWSREADGAEYIVNAADVASATPLIFSLGTREAGFMADRVVFSTVSDLTDAALDALLNSEVDVVTQGETETFLSFEAEKLGATLIAGTPTTWVRTNDVAASGGSALYGEGLASPGDGPHSFAQYQLRFATPGTYYLYYRWKADPARTAGDIFTANSTYIPNTFGNLSTPGDQTSFHASASNGRNAPESNVYGWSREADGAEYIVSAADVASATPLIFSLGTREAGFMADRLVFSTVPDLTDAALDALPNSGAQAVAPELVKAVGSASLSTVQVSFTRPLAPGSVNTGGFIIAPALAVSGVQLDPGDARIVRLTTAPQTQGTLYTITVNGVTDTGGTPIAPDSTVTFSAWAVVPGWVTKEVYFGIAGGTIADLLADPSYPDSPDRVEWVRQFAVQFDPFTDNYGARLTAFFTPSETGVHEFFVNNDDEAELLMSPDTSESNLESLGIFPLKAPPFSDLGFTISLDSLAAGTPYLLRGLLKQGAADVYLEVAATPQTASQPPPETLPILSGSQLSTYINPDAGRVIFDEPPQAVTASEGSRAQFQVKVTTETRPVYYQWQVNGEDIPGGTRSLYLTPVLASSDNGNEYRVIISVAGTDTPSDPATLTVTPGEPSNLEPYVGINFVGGGGGALGGTLMSTDVAGAVPQEHWNNLSGATFDNVALTDATGAATPVTLFATAAGTFYAGTGAGDDATADGVLLQGYIHNNNAPEPIQVVLNGVPNGTYHLLVYCVGFQFQATYEQAVDLDGAVTYPTLHVQGQTGLDYNRDPGLVRMSSTDPDNRDLGNYVQFDNVSPFTDGSLGLLVFSESLSPGNGLIPALNAIQLVRVNPITARPALGSSLGSPNTLTLSWGAAAAGYVLESSATLGATSNWTLVDGSPNPIAGAGSFEVQTTASGGYYRLRQNE